MAEPSAGKAVIAVMATAAAAATVGQFFIAYSRHRARGIKGEACGVTADCAPGLGCVKGRCEDRADTSS